MPVPLRTLEDRIEQARSLAEERSLSALLLCAAPRRNGGIQTGGNVAHFTGYSPLGGITLLLVPAKGRPVVIAEGTNEQRMLSARIAALAEVRRTGSLAQTVEGTLADCSIPPHAPLGIAGMDELPFRTGRALAQLLTALMPLDAEVHALRAQVDPADVALHQEASRISDAMITRAFEMATRPGMTPAGLMAEIEFAGRKMGAEIARLWLAVGPRPPVTCFEFFELPPAINPGDRIQLGTTVCVDGHYSQGLRMAVWGEPDAALIDAVDRLLAIQDETLAQMLPGRPAHAVVDTLERLIDETCPYSRDTDPFRFQSCHQLGLDYSDAGLAAALNASRDKTLDRLGPVLRVGQVLEIHPNYNLPGLGHVCAGDAAVVTETGARWLTRYPRGLAVLR